MKKSVIFINSLHVIKVRVELRHSHILQMYDKYDSVEKSKTKHVALRIVGASAFISQPIMLLKNVVVEMHVNAKS